MIDIDQNMEGYSCSREETSLMESTLSTDMKWEPYGFDENFSCNDIFRDIDENFDMSQFNLLPELSTESQHYQPINHDCMWAGHCGDQDHEETGYCCNARTVIHDDDRDPVLCPPLAVFPDTKQESLLKSSVQAKLLHNNPALNNPVTLGNTLNTPPESDDEESNKKGAGLLKVLNDAINECDSDLTAYFDGKKAEDMDLKDVLHDQDDDEEEEEEEEEESVEEEEEEEEEGADVQTFDEFRIRSQWAADMDHSYYKDKNATLRNLNSYGLDTPSDSEEDEEIDVVSVNEKLSQASRMALSLPHNPSSQDKRHLQKRVASAMSRTSSQTTGIKTILPVQRGRVAATVAQEPPVEVPATTTSSKRGTKRGRAKASNTSATATTTTTTTTTTTKRRRVNNEDRPAIDKRHLHNDMERQRRIDLRKAFEHLKSMVPNASESKKIAKVNILMQAANYCYTMTNQVKQQSKELAELKREQAYLRAKLSHLRKSQAIEKLASYKKGK